MSPGESRALAAVFFCQHLLSVQLCLKKGGEHVTFADPQAGSVLLDPPKMFPINFTEVVWKGTKGVVKTKTFANGSVRGKLGTLFPNGSLLLDSLNEVHFGVYQLEMFNEEGRCLLIGSTRLHAQEPVSKPILTSLTCHNGTIKLFCDVRRGDNISLSWEVQLDTLPTSHILSEKDPILAVEKGKPGKFMCRAWNNVSEETSNVVNPRCPDGNASQTPPDVIFRGKGVRNPAILVLLLCACASLSFTTLLYLVFLSLAQQTKSSGNKTSKQRSDMRVFYREEAYIDMQSAGCIMDENSFRSGAGRQDTHACGRIHDRGSDGVYVTMNNLCNQEETSKDDTPQDEPQLCDPNVASVVGSDIGNVQLVYAQINIEKKNRKYVRWSTIDNIYGFQDF